MFRKKRDLSLPESALLVLLREYGLPTNNDAILSALKLRQYEILGPERIDFGLNDRLGEFQRNAHPEKDITLAMYTLDQALASASYFYRRATVPSIAGTCALILSATYYALDRSSDEYEALKSQPMNGRIRDFINNGRFVNPTDTDFSLQLIEYHQARFMGEWAAQALATSLPLNKSEAAILTLARIKFIEDFKEVAQNTPQIFAQDTAFAQDMKHLKTATKDPLFIRTIRPAPG